MTPSGIEPVTFWLVGHCLNLLCHCVLPPTSDEEEGWGSYSPGPIANSPYHWT